jgi:hypothetical protein
MIVGAAHQAEQLSCKRRPEVAVTSPIYIRVGKFGLEHMRGSYKSETGWAPPHVGKQLRDVRLGADTMRLRAIRAQQEARIVKDQAIAARHADIAATARELESKYRER